MTARDEGIRPIGPLESERKLWEHRADSKGTSAPQLEYIGKDGRSHFHVTAGDCVCGQSIINNFEWERHLKMEAAIPKEFPTGFPLHEIPSALPTSGAQAGEKNEKSS